MTAPLLNLPLANPAAGAAGASAPGASAQGPAAGFQVLLAAFFGVQGEGDAATGLFGETDAPKDEAAAGEALPADASLIPSANADALAFAAQLAAPAVQAQLQAAPQPTSDTDGQAPAAAPVFAPIPPPAAGDQATTTTLDTAATAKPAKTSEAVLAETLAAAPAAEDVATPASAKAPVQPETKADPGRTPPPSTGLNAMPKPAEAAAHAAKLVSPQPQPIATAAGSVPTELVAAEAASELAPVTEPGKEKSTPGAKAAESARKGAQHAASAAAPVADPDAPTAIVAAADAASLGDDTSAPSQDDIATPAPASAKPEPAKTNAADAQAAGPAAPAHASAQAQAHASIHSAVRGSPETVANLAAQIIQKLDGRSTRFDVELNPIGLGQVNVAVEIAANGKMTAALSFETQHAANELRGRSADLQRALEQAGFDVSGGLSFDVAGDGRSAWADQQQQQQQQQANGAWRGRAFQAVLGTAGDAADLAAASALNPQRRTRSGVDVKV